MHVDVTHKKTTLPIEAFDACANTLLILANNKLWVINCLGVQYPDIEVSGIRVCKVRLVGKTVFLVTDAKEILFCTLGGHVLTKMPVMFDVVRFGKQLMFSSKNTLFTLKDCVGEPHVICGFAETLTDFVSSKGRVFVVLSRKVLWARMRGTIESSVFCPVAMLTNFEWDAVHANSEETVFAENTDYIVCLTKRKPILVKKPSVYYDVCFARRHVVFLAQKVHFVSIITGQVEKVVGLTGFKSACDFRTNSVWVYANSLFEMRIAKSPDVVYMFPERVIAEKIAAGEHAQAARIFIKAHKNSLIAEDGYDAVKMLIVRIKSKFITRALMQKLGEECIRLMVKHGVYINLVSYIRLSTNITDHIQTVFRVMESSPRCFAKDVHDALRTKLAKTDSANALLATSLFILGHTTEHKKEADAQNNGDEGCP